MWTAPEYNTGILDKAWAQPEMGRMMLNENPVPPSDAVVAAITDMAKKGNRYPDRAYRLREKLGKLHGVAAENIALANGSSETIDAMMRIFLQPGDEFLCSNPTFEMFPSRAGLCNAKTVQIPLREPDLQYDVPGMLAAVNDKTKLILIINPNNPTGIFIEDADLRKFCELGIPLCIDEAYLDYHPDVEAKIEPRTGVPERVPLAHLLQGLRPRRRALRLRGRPSRRSSTPSTSCTCPGTSA